MSTDDLINRICELKAYRSGERLTIGKVSGLLSAGKENVSVHRVKEVLRLMTNNGNLEMTDTGSGKNRRVSWTRRSISCLYTPWRTVSNEQLGIKQTRLGVPV